MKIRHVHTDIDPTSQSNSRKAGLVRSAGAAIALGLAALPGCVDNSKLAKLEKAPSVEEQAALIGKTLSEGKVVHNVNVERGMESPQTDNMPKGAVAAVNPVVFGRGRYGFLVFDRDGDVTVKVTPEGTELRPASMGDDRFHPTEVQVDIVRVYDTYENTATHQPERFYRVVIGRQPGNIDDQIHVDPSLTQLEQNMQYSQQIGAIEAGRVGDLVYYGK